MTDRDQMISEDELHAYVDGELPADRRGAVEAWLAVHADDAARVAAWRARYDASGRTGARKIGLVFRANPESGSCLDRSMEPADLAPFAALRQVDFVNLQHGPLGRTLGALVAGAFMPALCGCGARWPAAWLRHRPGRARWRGRRS